MKIFFMAILILFALAVILETFPGNMVAASCGDCNKKCRAKGDRSGKCINSKCKCYP
uniref:Uncharacterized protein n=1 Tax=Isometrus maculatus TaxID=497827 RepID=A0A0U1S616_ISOMC|nr:hypothetical protein [Isometrus maculatus]